MQATTSRNFQNKEKYSRRDSEVETNLVCTGNTGLKIETFHYKQQLLEKSGHQVSDIEDKND